MKTLALICAGLLLLNLGVFLWPTASSQASHIYGERPPVNPHFIRLNKEIEDKYLAKMPVDQQKVDSEFAAAPGQHCYRVGPFMHNSNYELAQAVLFNAKVEYHKSTRQETQSDVTRLYLGDFATRAEAADQRTQLKRNNILDHFVKATDDGQYIVSLGIYTTDESVQSALDLLGQKVSDIKLRKESILLPKSYWLHFAMDQKSKTYQQLSAIDWGEQSAKLGKYSCRVTQ